MKNMKEELLKTLKENPGLLKELLEEAPELKTTIKQVMKPQRDKSLLGKLEKWGIKKEEIPEEYLKHINVVEDFLNWLDHMIREKTSYQKALHLSLRPLVANEQNEQNSTNNTTQAKKNK